MIHKEKAELGGRPTHPDPSDHETMQADAGAASLLPCRRCSAATLGERERSWEGEVLDVSEIYIIIIIITIT